MCNLENSLSHASRASSLPEGAFWFGIASVICIKDEDTGIVSLEEKRGSSRKVVGFWQMPFHHQHGFAVKSTVAKAILTPVMQRDFVGADVHPTTFREEPKKGVRGKKETFSKVFLLPPRGWIYA